MVFRLGFQTTVSKGVDLKSHVDNTGAIEAAAILQVNPHWKMTIATATTAAHLNGNQAPTFGIGLVGQLD